jgi:ElaB/YqjD/DUF883 family membrane-anchored ribosome-binding protein
MGKGSTEIQRDIEHQRDALSRRIDQLDRRVRDDVEKSRNEAQARVDSLAERAKGTTGKAKDQALGVKDRAGQLNQRVEDSPVGEHPNLLLAGSFATGLLLGVVTGGGGEHEDGRPRQAGGKPEHQPHGFQEQRPGRIEQGFESLLSSVKAEAIVMVRDFVDRTVHRGGQAAEDGAEGMPAFLRSAWDNISSRIEPERKHERATNDGGPHVEMHDRDLPRDRPLSDLEERTAEDMGIER